jgi:hypothetical protein
MRYLLFFVRGLRLVLLLFAWLHLSVQFSDVFESVTNRTLDECWRDLALLV